MKLPHFVLCFVGLVALLVCACASAPPAAPQQPRPVQTYEEKMAWILRLEEDRVLRLAPAEAPPPPLPPPTRGRGALVVAPAPPPSPDLVALLRDDMPRIRRRAALAVGRVRLGEGVAPLAAVLAGDIDAEVRQMAAFAMGLIGDASGADALLTALGDRDPLVQGRAAEALGLLAHKAAATPIATMMTAHIAAGALTDTTPDDLGYPKAAATEAVRLGIYALVRLAAYDALASALLDRSGEPVSRWWPVAYAFQRIADVKAAPVLLNLLQGEGAMTRAFAARGLGLVKEQRAIAPLIALVAKADEPPNVRIQAVRALAALHARQAVDPLTKLLTTPNVDANLRLEAVIALGQMGDPRLADLFVDLVTETWPTMRAAALTALARTDADTFLTAISGLDPDRHWSVRAALATALGSFGPDRAEPRLLLMLDDSDQRVVPAVLSALVEAKAPGAEKALIARLNAEDVVVRQAAASGLGRLKSRAAVTPLLEAYERAEKDPTYVARAATLAALADLDPNASAAVIDRALADRDWAMRVRAAALLKQIDPAADVARIRPAPGAALPELNDLKALIAPPVSPMAYIDTEKGMIQIELAVLDAPRTVTNFVSLARRNFLGATPFHRVVPDFVVQDGDPRGDGEGGPGYTIRDEINQLPYLRGTVGMALDWEDTGGSQFFITHSPQPHLDGRYTVFGRVVQGLDVVDRLQQWDQIRSVRVWDGANWIGPQ
jgi:cyclophilin family peptidyl-prolyl cis-trans isomerase/HEAT repeat protein